MIEELELLLKYDLRGADLATALLKSVQRFHNDPRVDEICMDLYPRLRQRGHISE